MVSAQDVEWGNAGSGAWGDAGNWVGGSVPGFTNQALINNGGTAQVDATTSPFPDVAGLFLGQSAGESGNFQMSGGEFFTEVAQFGEEGTATVDVTGGDLQVGGGSLFVGGRDGVGVGVLNVSGATTSIKSADDWQLGRVGEGTMNQSGGQIEGGFTVVGKFGTGIWNQSGGLFNARNDLEIGDGGRPDQAGTAGPREGTINLSGGVLHSSAAIAIGNRNGTGTVNVSGGILSSNGQLYVGRGADWGAGEGAPVELSVTGGDGTIIVNGDFLMNPLNVATSSTLVAEITGAEHTTIRVAGDADIANGILAVELNGFSPSNGDTWTLLEAGADLSAEKQAIEDFVATNEFNSFGFSDPAFIGARIGEFSALDLPSGFSVSYTATTVVLEFTQTTLPADLNGDGFVDGLDLGILLGNFDSNTTPAGGELNGTDPVDGLDLGILLGAWAPPGAIRVAAVPEPGAVVLFAIGTLTLLGRRRRLTKSAEG